MLVKSSSESTTAAEMAPKRFTEANQYLDRASALRAAQRRTGRYANVLDRRPVRVWERNDLE
jgi:hypothetical protein